jgi:hypothetical protein
MTEFVSDIKSIPHGGREIFDALSDLTNLERLRDKISQEKIRDFSFDKDSCSFNMDPVGKIKLSIVDRDPNKTIKFKVDELPMDLSMWIQLKQVEEKDTKMKLTIKAELNPFLKPILSKPLQEGINKVAEILANIPYDKK